MVVESLKHEFFEGCFEEFALFIAQEIFLLQFVANKLSSGFHFVFHDCVMDRSAVVCEMMCLGFQWSFSSVPFSLFLSDHKRKFDMNHAL